METFSTDEGAGALAGLLRWLPLVAGMSRFLTMVRNSVPSSFRMMISLYPFLRIL